MRAGASVLHLRRILGHSSLEITRRYVNLGAADLEAIPQRFSFLARSSR